MAKAALVNARDCLSRCKQEEEAAISKAKDKTEENSVRQKQKKLVSKAWNDSNDAEQKMNRSAVAAEMAREEEASAWSKYAEHMQSLPPAVEIPPRRRWSVAQQWLEEREIEEMTARKLGSEPRPCCWAGEKLSEELQALVDQSFAFQQDCLAVWKIIEAWIGGSTQIGPGGE